MFCTKCGNKLQDDDAFCPKCGKRVTSASQPAEHQDDDTQQFKCPFCGAPLPSFATSCPECGQELRDGSARDIKELVSKIEALQNEEAFVNDGVSIFKQTDSYQERIETLIRSFQIPKTKEGLLEFITLAAANIDTSSSNNRISRAWKAKFEEAESRVRFIQGDERAKADALEICQRKQREIEKAERKERRSAIALFVFSGVLIIAGLLYSLLEKMI